MKTLLLAVLGTTLFGQAPNLLDRATLRATAPATFTVRFNTTKGNVVIRVTRAWAPNGADRFYNLVRGGFYNDVAFFRVIRTPEPFMAQFGISGRPEVNKVWAQANIQDDPVKESNTRGKVTFAQTGAPNSRSTQVFINYRNNSFLDPQRFAPFGEVIEGMEVMDSLYSTYGEQASEHQDLITAQGKAYLDRNFPRLDKITTATLEPAPDSKK